MACINMFNPDHQGGHLYGPPPMSPRISFSNDFVVEPPPVARNPAPPADPNFEFSVGSHPMMAADQLFFKGRLLPLKDNGYCSSSGRITTLRDELRENGDDGGLRPPKGSIKWKGLLGFKKSHCSAAKKMTSDKNEAAFEATDTINHGKSTQEL